jgi:hypothetical protein
MSMYYHLGLKTVGTVGVVLGSFATVQGLLPTPVVYARADVNVNKLQMDRNPVKDPIFHIKFGNIGFGPMFVYNVEWYANGKKVSNLMSTLEKEHDTWIITSESVLGERNGKPFAHDKLLPILTIRPRDVANDAWHQDVIKSIREQKIECRIEYSYFDTFPFRWLKRTKSLSITQ